MVVPEAGLNVSESREDAVHNPDAWTADLVSADGRTARIRPIRPEDDERVLRM
jgi:hypothetical protein